MQNDVKNGGKVLRRTRRVYTHLCSCLMRGDNLTDKAELWCSDSTHHEENQQWMITWMGPIDLQIELELYSYYFCVMTQLSVGEGELGKVEHNKNKKY